MLLPISELATSASPGETVHFLVLRVTNLPVRTLGELWMCFLTSKLQSSCASSLTRPVQKVYLQLRVAILLCNAVCAVELGNPHMPSRAGLNYLQTLPSFCEVSVAACISVKCDGVKRKLQLES